MNELDDHSAPEDRTRVRIDAMLARAGSAVQDYRSVNLYAGRGIAVRELVTTAGPADYALFVDRHAVGVIEANKRGTAAEIVEDLEAALEEFRALAESLEAIEIDVEDPAEAD